MNAGPGAPEQPACRVCGAPWTGDELCRSCGAEMTPALVDGRYVIERELGRGAMGVVYLANDKFLGRKAALKVIAPHVARDVRAMDAFRREAAALASIRNDHVVQVYTFGPQGGSFYFAMELISGMNLDEVISEHAQYGIAVPVSGAVSILAAAATGLHAAHLAGVIHRDVKPSNIVIEERTGRPVLIDFGLARPSDGGRQSVLAGSPAYMAPEQASDQPLTGGADVYALACTGFELLTGRLPFVGESQSALLLQHALNPAPLLSSLRPELAPLDAVFARALLKDPAERFRTALELAEALHGLPAIGDPTDRPSYVEAPPPPSSGPTGAPRVLVIDDDDSFRVFAARAAQLAFGGQRASVTMAPSGRAAFAAASAHMPRLILLDFDMPGVDGANTLTRLRQLPNGQRAVVIVVSARAPAEVRAAFAMLGVTDFVSKPVDLRVLVETIARAVRSQRWDEKRA